MVLSDEPMRLIQTNLEGILTEINVTDGINSDDFERLKNSIESVSQDCNFFNEISRHFKDLVSFTSSLEHQLDQLRRENDWISKEFDSSQRESVDQQQRIAALESENEQLRLMIQLHETSPKAVPTSDPQPTNEEIDIKESESVPQPIPDNLATLNNLVLEYAAQGRYEVAVPLCKQALSELELLSGEDHPEIATLLNILALAYRDQGQYKLAAKYLERCLSIKERLYGEKHSSVAATLNNLAILYGKRGKYKDAEPLCKRALKIREDTLGVDHPDTAKQLNNLGLVCQHLGRYDEVEGYYLRALDIYRGLPEKDDLNIMKTTNNLASAYLKLEKFDQAETLYKSIINEFQLKIEGSPSVSVWELAEARAGTEDFSEVLSEVLPRWIKVVDIYGVSIVTTLTNLSALYKRKARRAAGEFIEELVRAVKTHCESQEDTSNSSIIVSTADL